MGRRIFETLQALFAHNPALEFYIERKDCLPAIVNRLAYGLGAEDCFAALISSNYDLLKKVDSAADECDRRRETKFFIYCICFFASGTTKFSHGEWRLQEDHPRFRYFLVSKQYYRVP